MYIFWFCLFQHSWKKPLSLSEVCWRSGVPIEGDQDSISQAVAARVSRRKVKQCGVLRPERGKRFEVKGWRLKARISKLKFQMEKSRRSGKTSSERESKIFSPSFEKEGAPQGFWEGNGR
jgi:hypothetical protein